MGQSTANTFTSVEALAEELEATRRRGYALDNEEHEADINCIAAPLFGMGGVAAGAISIAAPAYPVRPDALLGASGVLLDATHTVSIILGAGSGAGARGC